ncbi:MAG: permease, partial [Psychromonas sp.]|nr:permease [Psychromonas sp.]
LIKARAAFGPIMAFLFTSPLLNPFIVGLFGLTFGAKVTLTYSLFVIILAILSGYVLEKFHFERFIKTDLFTDNCAEKTNTETPDSNKCEGSKHQQLKTMQPASPHWKKLLVDTSKQFISFAPYMMIGVAVGALLHGYVPQNAFENLKGYSVVVIIPLAAVIGVFLYVRASTMVPIATALIAKGMTMGSVISLTIAGAGASLPEMIMMKRMFHWPLMFAFIFVVFATACITGFAIELI